jgi:exopolyphosphatase/pppGpp-phosphohydrolase
MEIAKSLSLLTPNEIAEKYPFAEKRKDVIAHGANILAQVVKAFNLDGVITSESDNLEGYLRYLGNSYEEN